MLVPCLSLRLICEHFIKVFFIFHCFSTVESTMTVHKRTGLTGSNCETNELHVLCASMLYIMRVVR